LKTRTTVKYEALVRYREEDGTIIPPAVFLPAAGRYKLMPALDRAIFRLMLADLTTHPDLQVAVNLAGSTFIEEKFAAWLEETMTMAGVAPGRITLEITETEFMHDLGKARLAAERYHQLGFLLSLDDFGVGFSSMNYLRQLPVDFVKIDGSFVSRIQEDPVDLALLRSIKEIARLLGKQTVAEYVNRDDLAEFLAKEGVDFGQGYGLGKPAPLEIVLG